MSAQDADTVVVTHLPVTAIRGGWIARCGVFLDTASRHSQTPSCPYCAHSGPGCGRPTALTAGPTQHCGDPGVPLCPACRWAALIDGRDDHGCRHEPGSKDGAL